MNLVIAVFLYLGLTYPGDTITKTEYNDHKAEVEATQNDPAFLDFYDQLYIEPGVVIMDPDAFE